MLCVTRQLILQLNVRSILSKLPDIRADSNLTSASMLCFCETWLNAARPSPHLIKDQIDIRCDRLTCENKGGVLIYIPRKYRPSNIHKYAVSATFNITNHCIVQIALVYRSPSTTNTTVSSLLHRLLTHFSVTNIPSIILGDFNENILQQQNSALLRLMNDFGFTQLLHSPTTDQGTLIDHIYYRQSRHF